MNFNPLTTCTVHTQDTKYTENEWVEKSSIRSKLSIDATFEKARTTIQMDGSLS